MLNVMIVLADCIITLLVFDYHKFQELLFDTLKSRNAGVKSVGYHTLADFLLADKKSSLVS